MGDWVFYGLVASVGLFLLVWECVVTLRKAGDCAMKRFAGVLIFLGSLAFMGYTHHAGMHLAWWGWLGLIIVCLWALDAALGES
jgi:hypothetical protein